MEDAFKKRELAFEAVYANQRDHEFRVKARGAKMFGAWAAAKMGVKGDEARRYMRFIAGVVARKDGELTALEQVSADMAAAGRVIGRRDAVAMYHRCGARAEAQLLRF